MKNSNLKKYLRWAAGLLIGILILFYKQEKEGLISTYIGLRFEEEKFTQYLKHKMEENKIPGLSIAVINHGKICYQKSLGWANVETSVKVDSLTVFEAASLSKSVFAFFVMTFVEDGIIDLDSPLYQYYPHPDINRDERYKKITARMVLCHRSGLPNWREDEEGGLLKTQFEPNSNYLYSGEGYQYLAMVLMHLTETDHEGLEKLFQDRVAKPLGLKYTVFIQTPYTRKHKAEPYDSEKNWINWHRNYWFQKEDGKYYAPASLHSNPSEFAKWMLVFMNEKVLSRSSYRELKKAHTEVPYDELNLTYSLGFLKPSIPFTDFYIHSGNNEGFTAWYAMDVKKKWGFVLFANSDNGEKLGEMLFFDLLIGYKFDPLIIRYMLYFFGLIILYFLFKIFVKRT